MRRPLAGTGLIFILILLIIQLLMQGRMEDAPNIRREHTVISGRLVRIEHKVRDGEVTTILYLIDPQELISSDPPQYEPTVLSDRDMAICYLSGEDPRIELGSTISLAGRVSFFDEASNPGMFDSARYYSCMHIAYRVSVSDIRSVSSTSITPYWRLKGRLYRLSESIGILCDLCFDESDAPVIKSILLGDRSGMDEDTKSMYARNGISHILAISGLHISMLGMGMAALLKKCRLPRAAAYPAVIMMMILYGIMTGMAASAFRAIVMFALRMMAELIHRTYDMATALVIAAVMILISQPEYLFYTGFQFSFGAMMAILLVYPALSDVFPRLLSAGISVITVTLPVYLHNYFYFPLLSVVLNLYIIPLMSILLGASLIALAGCAIFIPLGRLLAVPAHLILLIYEYSCRICDTFTLNRYVTGKPYVMSTIIYVILLILILALRRYQSSLQVMMNLIFAGMILVLKLHSGISVTMIDVGQGDGIYITDNLGADYLIDGGSSSVTNVGKYRLAPFLYSQGVSSLDGVCITHLDSDHYNGILELIEDGGRTMPRIEKVFMTSSAAAGDSETYHRICEACEMSGVPVYIISQDDILTDNVLTLKCLYPDPSCTGADTNAESLVLHMTYGTVHLLFTGDLEGAGETAIDRIIPRELTPQDTLILKAAHHGSKYSSYDEFLDLAGPDMVLISAGRNNSYGHPDREFTDRLDMRGIPWFNTADHGAIRVDIRGSDIRLSGYLKAADPTYPASR